MKLSISKEMQLAASVLHGESLIKFFINGKHVGAKNLFEDHIRKLASTKIMAIVTLVVCVSGLP